MFRRLLLVTSPVLLAGAIGCLSTGCRSARHGGGDAVHVHSGVVAVSNHAARVFYTSGYEGSVLYIWDLRDPDRPVVRVFRCKHSLGKGSYRQEFELPPRTDLELE